MRFNPLVQGSHFFAELLNITPVEGLFFTLLSGAIILGVIIFTLASIFEGKK